MEYKPRTDEEWLELIREQRSSGLTQKAWCMEKGISQHTMWDRIRKFRILGMVTGPSQTVGRGGLPTHTHEEWQELIKEQQASGRTLEEWCAENSVNRNTMADVASRLRKNGLLGRKPVSNRPKTYAPRRSDEEWQELINEQRASGQTLDEWCTENGVKSNTLIKMTTRLRNGGQRAPAVKRTREEWLELSERQRASGLSLAVWCAKNEINYGTMKERMRRIRKSDLSIVPIAEKEQEFSSQNQWVEISTDVSASSRRSKAVPSQETQEFGELRILIGKFTIAVPPSFEETALTNVCEVLMSLC